MSVVAGRLHNLCLDVEEDRVSWHALSRHYVSLASNVVEKRSASASQSVTPSPQKKQKTVKPALQSWTLCLCQIVQSSNNDEEKTEDSETESEEEDENQSFQVIAWYSAQIKLSQSINLLKESGETSWDTLELRVRVAWDGNNVDVMGKEKDKALDGTYSSVKLAFDSVDADIEGEEDASKSNVEVVLQRLERPDDIIAASLAFIELSKALNILKGQTESLKQERDGHRKLLQNNRRHERFKEANSSLVNPGRLKRKTQDDEGFEGDEEEEEEA